MWRPPPLNFNNSTFRLTCFTGYRPPRATGHLWPRPHNHQLSNAMSQQPNTFTSSHESRIILAIRAIEEDAFLSVKRAALLYNVPRSSIRHRLAGCTPKRDWKPVNMNLTMTEESAIVQRILDLDSWGFPPTKDALRDIANKLLKERGRNLVGKNWPDAFLKRTPELKKWWSRA